MLDWLKRSPGEEPRLQLGERELPVAIRRLPHARRMTLRLAPDGSEVRLSIPRWVRTAEALAFARSRQDWLASQLSAMRPRTPPAHGAYLPFRGETLRIEHVPASRRRPECLDGVLRLGGPEDALPQRIKRWLEGQARDLIEQDLTEYCLRADKAVPRVALSGAQRRWGSCAADGTIRINWRLIMAPDFVRRSVIAHEVAHLVHFDHSPGFHAFLGELFEGEVEAANAWLKKEGRGLYAFFG